MDRKQLSEYITNTYGVNEEFLWKRDPNSSVFRHHGNKKWFAVCMTIAKSKLNLIGNDMIDIINVKCDPVFVGAFRDEKGIYPAYHMNKAHWISIVFNGSLNEDKIKWLVDQSFNLTILKK